MEQAFRLLVRRAWGLADVEAELARLLGYARLPGGRLSFFTAAAAAAFARQGDELRRILHSELDSLTGSAALPPIALAPRDLSRALHALECDRPGIGASQLHMTANRVGLNVREEIYFSRLRVRSLEAPAGTAPHAEGTAEREGVLSVPLAVPSVPSV